MAKVESALMYFVIQEYNEINVWGDIKCGLYMKVTVQKSWPL